jgi:RNA polymerase sigma-70 factor (ECF subfamily)
MSSLSGAQFEADLPAVAPEGQRELELLRKAQKGDRGSYGQLVAAYQDRLYNAVLRMVGDREEAKDLTQEAFTRGLMNLDSFRGESAPYTWLFRIAVNLAISQLRKVQRRRVFSLNASGRNGNGRHVTEDQASSLMDRLAASSTLGAPQDLERRELAEQVLGALGRLDAEYRAVLVMRDIEGFDYQQMAEVLGLPLGTLKSRLFRARLAMRDELKSYMSDGRQ